MRKYLVALGIGSLLVLSACGEGENGNGAEEADAEDTDEGEESEDENGDEEDEDEDEDEDIDDLDQTFSVGETVDIDGYMIEVTSVDEVEGEEFESPADGNVFTAVELQLENESDENVSYNPLDFSVQDGSGNIEGTTIVTSDDELSSGELAPDGETSGTVTFETPEDDDELILIYEENLFTDDTVEISLED
ncbi:DUF4352 domain-containing protein [Salicibibacter cibarius]|uniref:DUF4352 domain-containing protein n=1 Tax=Salicibibacter cibarius TaxID=2743000 RepID=A0A7T6Z1J7_9BACI|nr:DUF4352 domain-containing protein [Salicibibacter cibarius]QQK75249.1 DUF4352 domain-containing protein [Salicibibacter cibarius]